MKAASFWAIGTGTALVLAASAGFFIGRPIHLSPAERTGPSAAPIVAAVQPRIGARSLLPPARPFTAAPAKTGSPATPMTPAGRPADDLSPSTNLVQGFQPGLPPMQAPPAGNLAASPTPNPQPATPNTVWRELPSQQQEPTLRVVHSDALPHQNTTLIVWNGSFSRQWEGWGSGVIIQASLPAGVYRYEIRGPSYANLREPDMAGVLRCRRYRLYEIQLCYRDPWDPDGTIFEDLGDRR